MKHVCASLLILSLILALCLCSAFATSSAVAKTQALLEDALTEGRAGDFGAALESLRAASRFWESRQTYFGTVLRHDAVDSVMAEFVQLEVYAQLQDQDDFLSEGAALLTELDHITQMEWPLLHNIL